METILRKNEPAELGDKIRIIRMEGDDSNDPAAAEYRGREGVVKHIDSMGQLHGTWGSLAVIPEADEYEIVEKRAEPGEDILNLYI